MPKPAEVTLPSDREVCVVRSFNAPRKMVWDAHTKPELIRKWMFGLPGWTMPVCEMDVRVGGSFRWRWRNQADGKEMGFFGDFREVDEPNRLVYAENYDPGDAGFSMPSGEPAIITAEFKEDSGGVTTLTTTMRFPSKEARDGAVSTGMTDGMEMSYARLDDVFAKAG
jgi:uncharacterized protein YndB with AHSA1/START domain